MALPTTRLDTEQLLGAVRSALGAIETARQDGRIVRDVAVGAEGALEAVASLEAALRSLARREELPIERQPVIAATPEAAGVATSEEDVRRLVELGQAVAAAAREGDDNTIVDGVSQIIGGDLAENAELRRLLGDGHEAAAASTP